MHHVQLVTGKLNDFLTCLDVACADRALAHIHLCSFKNFVDSGTKLRGLPLDVALIWRLVLLLSLADRSLANH